MTGLLATFFSSFIATLLIIRFKRFHERFTSDFDLTGPQKFHANAVPRIGGISIAIGLFIGILFRAHSTVASDIGIILLICAIPTFAIGLTEDLTKAISIRLRLVFTALSATLLVHLIPAQITHIDIPYIDILFALPIIGALLAIFAITGLANAYNIIDGFNGLASMVGIITLMAIAYVSFVVKDFQVMHLSIIMASAILGFFIWNYPYGLIFLGDGGAYLIGFWIASLSIALTYRHQEISPWFALIINGYPVIETLFTIYRRKIHQGKCPGQPDGIHFHTLIYRRILKSHPPKGGTQSLNSRTAPYLWCFTLLGISPAILWWRSTEILIFSSLIFVGAYLWAYERIVRFKTPSWIRCD